ncbi:Putative NADH-flavin reductase [Mariprofundus ferrinatatus]|uniref:NADH-flavin reductase n=1 Tax=Mariprofundus ferrinatatus TaxID=1921087 RepID=A0A2K8L932_9PROT|nr:SDR family oxidoreductase [Mariprofundus ferrinatatus]ATX82401.1 Putative NADH-flavin reductase [Mariprofundus ferrinatatus]
MKILIIGASRGIGLELVKQAIDAGHYVTALMRDKSVFDDHPHKRLKVRQGDIHTRKIVEGACVGQDAVCITVGMVPSSKPVNLFSEGSRNVLSGMKRAGVKRLLAVTGIGAGDSEGHGGFLYDKVTRPVLLKHLYDDKNRQEEIIRASDCDWTIIRPALLTRTAKTGNYRVLTDLTGVKAGKISRKDVAHFMLGELEHPEYIHQTPLLTY